MVPPSEMSYSNLQRDGEPLRSNFNEAAGKVRAIFLAGPT